MAEEISEIRLIVAADFLDRDDGILGGRLYIGNGGQTLIAAMGKNIPQWNFKTPHLPACPRPLALTAPL